MIIKLLNFNAYYNRQYKRLPADYSNLVVHEQYNVNFNPNDGINTSLVLNLPSTEEPYANYCLVLDDITQNVVSRWFIIDAARSRLNQYEIVLRRDLIAEYFNDIINAPVFIEKATLNNESPLIFNSENMSFNQIKTKETPLSDASGCPWIVGYFSKDYATESKKIKVEKEEVQQFTSYSSLEEVPYINAIRSGTFTGALETPVGMEVRAFHNPVFTPITYWRIRSYTDKTYSINSVTANPFDRDIRILELPTDSNISSFTNYIVNKFNADTAWYNSVVENVATKSSENSFKSTWPVAGKTIRVGTPTSGYKYYRIKRDSTITIQERTFSPDAAELAYTKMTEALTDSGLFSVLGDASALIRYNYSYRQYQISMEELADPASYSITIPANEDRTRLEDAPYDMFAIPYGSPYIAWQYNDSEGHLTPDKDIGLKLANEIATALGGTTNNLLFDLQLLPYCPIPDIIKPDFGFYVDARELTHGKDYVFLGDFESSPQKFVSVMFFPQKSDFSFSIDRVYHEGLDGYESLQVSITEPKIQALCDTYRLVSPNYNGQFEFNAAKNGGISYYNIDCSYKPYSPYIHINPNFDKLYGKDFNDARGLVCGGDFSLPTITDQWISYEINNKNYLNTFNRQIENMEINNRYGRQADVYQAIAGTVQGITSGATSGGIVGGALGGVGMGIGAGVGGLVGGIASGIAGMKDVEINQALRNEALDFTIDQFGYQLGNIQALPYSLNRVSSFNINNKIFPIVEYYTCTDIEKEALRDKIKYNGMTVMTIGRIASYLQPTNTYIKGKLIRLEGYDNHTVNEIANELNKGWYM